MVAGILDIFLWKIETNLIHYLSLLRKILQSDSINIQRYIKLQLSLNLNFISQPLSKSLKLKVLCNRLPSQRRSEFLSQESELHKFPLTKD